MAKLIRENVILFLVGITFFVFIVAGALAQEYRGGDGTGGNATANIDMKGFSIFDSTQDLTFETQWCLNIDSGSDSNCEIFIAPTGGADPGIFINDNDDTDWNIQIGTVNSSNGFGIALAGGTTASIWSRLYTDFANADTVLSSQNTHDLRIENPTGATNVILANQGGGDVRIDIDFDGTPGYVCDGTTCDTDGDEDGTRETRSSSAGFTIGSAGTAISESNRGTGTIDYASIAAQTCVENTITVTGAPIGAECSYSLPAAIDNGLSSTCYISATNTCTLRLCNVTSGAIDPASATYGCRTWEP